MNAAIADLNRWSLLAAIKGTLSDDRRKDMLAQAARLTTLIERL